MGSGIERRVALKLSRWTPAGGPAKKKGCCLPPGLGSSWQSGRGMEITPLIPPHGVALAVARSWATRLANARAGGARGPGPGPTVTIHAPFTLGHTCNAPARLVATDTVITITLTSAKLSSQLLILLLLYFTIGGFADYNQRKSNIVDLFVLCLNLINVKFKAIINF